jgi:hypothetical protein
MFVHPAGASPFISPVRHVCYRALTMRWTAAHTAADLGPVHVPERARLRLTDLDDMRHPRFRTIDEKIVATARCAKHAAADGNGPRHPYGILLQMVTTQMQRHAASACAAADDGRITCGPLSATRSGRV